MKKLICLLLALCLLLSFAACSKSTDSGKQEAQAPAAGTESSGTETKDESNTSGEYHIALIAPMTGNEAQYGEMQRVGAQIAVDQVNEEGGINGQTVVLDVFDDQNNTTQAATVAQMIIDDSRFDAAIGTYSSSNALAMAPLFDEAKMPFFCSVSSDGRIATEYTYTFQQNIAANYVWPIMADNAVQKLGGKKIALVALNNDAGEFFTNYATEEFEKLSADGSCELVASITYNEGEVSDFTPIVTQLKDADPDLVMINVQYQDMAAILRQSDQLGFTPKWYCVESLINDAFIELAGEYAVGLYCHCTYFIDDPSEGCVWLNQRCNEVGNMNANLFSRMSYEGTMQILTCAKNGAAGDRQKMYEALCSIGTWEGKTGTFAWTDTRQCICSVSIVELGADKAWHLLED